MPPHSETIKDICDEIQKREPCRAVHLKSSLIRTVLVDDILPIRKLFETDVETFELVGHACASLAYGWKLTQRTRDEPSRIVLYLHTASVSSPKSALDAWAKGDWLKSAA